MIDYSEELSTYSLDDILDIWEKDEKDLHDYKEK